MLLAAGVRLELGHEVGGAGEGEKHDGTVSEQAVAWQQLLKPAN